MEKSFDLWRVELEELFDETERALEELKVSVDELMALIFEKEVKE